MESPNVTPQITYQDVEDLAAGRKFTKDIVFTIDQQLAIKQARLLNSINGKLVFFVVLIILGIILSLLH